MSFVTSTKLTETTITMFPNHWAISSFCREVDGNCALLGYNKQRIVAIPCCRFGTICPFFKGSANCMGPTGSPDTSVRNYHYSLLNRLAKRFVFEGPSVDKWSMVRRVRERLEFRGVDRSIGMRFEVDSWLR